MQCFLLFVVLFVVVVTARGAAETPVTVRGAAETSATDCGAAESFRDSLPSGGGLQRHVVQQQRSAAADREAAETSAAVQEAREVSAEMAATLGRIEEFDGDQEEWLHGRGKRDRGGR